MRQVIRLFGPGRCMFASNAPVDAAQGWPLGRTYGAYLRHFGAHEELWAATARRAYRM